MSTRKRCRVTRSRQTYYAVFDAIVVFVIVIVILVMYMVIISFVIVLVVVIRVWVVDRVAPRHTNSG